MKPGAGARRPPDADSRRMAAALTPEGNGTAQPTPALDLVEAVDAFLLSRRVGNCTARTVETYTRALRRFAHTVAGPLFTCTPVMVQGYLADLRAGRGAITVHQHYRCLKTFFTWVVEARLLPEHPMRGLTMRAPKTLPRVPEDDEVLRLLASCPDTFEGRRNRALVALLGDSGLRISEALRLRVEDVNFAARTLRILGGKGQKDATGFFGATTAGYLRAWLSRRRELHSEEFLFCDREGRPLTRHWAARVLHRLSEKAGLPRKVGPHGLRHYAATSILRRTGDLELVRQVLRHESLAMALRYARLAMPDLTAKFRRASPLDNLRAGR